MVSASEDINQTDMVNGGTQLTAQCYITISTACGTLVYLIDDILANYVGTQCTFLKKHYFQVNQGKMTGDIHSPSGCDVRKYTICR